MQRLAADRSLLVDHAVARTERGEIVIRLARAPQAVAPSPFAADWEPDGTNRVEVGARVEVDIEVRTRPGRDTVPSAARSFEEACRLLEALGGRLYLRREEQASILSFRVAFSGVEAEADALIIPESVPNSLDPGRRRWPNAANRAGGNARTLGRAGDSCGQRRSSPGRDSANPRRGEALRRGASRRPHAAHERLRAGRLSRQESGSDRAGPAAATGAIASGG